MRNVLFLLLVFLAFGPAAAQRPDAPQYGQSGPFAVGTREFTLSDETRPLDVTVWYPALPDEDASRATYRLGVLLDVQGKAVRDAEPDRRAAPYPLVVYSHGSGSSRVLSLFYTEHLASYGFVVIAADHAGDTILSRMVGNTRYIVPSYVHRPADVLRLIDYAGTLSDDALAGMVDRERVAVTGHSFGGYTALAAGGGRLDFDSLATWCDTNERKAETLILTFGVCFMRDEAERLAELRGLTSVPTGAWPALSDERIDAIVALAPWNGPILDVAEVRIPTLLVVGTADDVTVPERDAFSIFERLSNAALVTLENAGHYIFVDSCPAIAEPLGLFNQCSDDVWDMQRAHDLTNHFSTAFLLAHLKDDQEAAAALARGAAEFTGVDYRMR